VPLLFATLYSQTTPEHIGGISPIGRFWKGRRETNVTLNSITAKYGAMSPASAERNAVPIKPNLASRSSGAGTHDNLFLCLRSVDLLL
jgi:hypothetical protein